MIRRLSASAGSFKTLTFREGLNILAAVKTRDATAKQTRNSAGKTSFVEIIHFLMGSGLRKGSLFKAEALSDWSFEIDFDLGGAPTQVVRSCDQSNWLMVEKANVNAWPVKPSTVRTSGESRIKNADWRVVLGTLMFGLSGASDEDEDDESGKGGPSFRQVFPYFARRQLAGGFDNPLKHNTQQQVGSMQVSLTTLLGLDWTVPGELQGVREQERSIKELKRAVSAKTLGDFVGNATDLRKQVALLQDRVTRLRKDVSDFRVVAEYHDLEREASELTRNINALADDNVLDEQARRSLEAAVRDERADAIGASDLEVLYREAGVALPGVTLRRFQDVQAFHESVVANRKAYLEAEFQATTQRLGSRAAEMERLNQRMAEIMRLLNTAGALEQFTELQSELARRESEFHAVKQRLDAAERLETTKAKLAIDRGRIYLRLQQDHTEQSARINEAIVTFEKISRALYESAGSFSVGHSEAGPVFDLKIQGARSKGISNMQMFCFDMMLMTLVSKAKKGPGFLIHDSHLFDGVDERQVGTALSVGATYAREYGFQYIVTMNEDAIPSECPPGFDPRNHLLPVRLTDASETGGLFGMRFE